MEPQFWHDRWRSGQIGFHQSAVDRHLKRHWPAFELARGSRVFVPLCGKSLDLLWLRDAGHSVVGVELSTLALEAFCLENGIPARRRIGKEVEVYEAQDLELIRGDFFALGAAQLGPIDALYDRAAAISWSPERRAPYIEHLAALAPAGTPMLLIAVEYPQVQMPGPPFSLPRADIERLYGRHFSIQELAREDTIANEERLRSRGVTEFAEVCYRLRRRESPHPQAS